MILEISGKSEAQQGILPVLENLEKQALILSRRTHSISPYPGGS